MAEEAGTGQALPSHIEVTLQAITDLHTRHQRRATPSQRAFSLLANILARPRFLGLITLLIAAWVGANLLAPALGYSALDPPPFYALQALVTVSALYTTVVILIAQKREDELAGLRERLILELALLSEQKNAKTIELLESLRRDLPTVPNRHDPEAAAMAKPADAMTVADAIIERHEETVLAAFDPTPEATADPDI